MGLIAALAACGNVKSSPDAPGGDDIDAPPSVEGDFTMTADPGSIEIPIASSRTATVSIQRTGDVGEVMLSASGAGANLTVEFSPNPIPADATSSTATITAKGGMAAASSTLMVVGMAGPKTHTANIAITTKTITVTGTVRGGRSGVTVGLVGKTSVTSGGGGAFTFTDVTPPYDLYTVTPTGCGSTTTTAVYYFDDLTRPDPTVTAAAAHTANCTILPPLCGIIVGSECPSASLTGTRSGVGNATDPFIAVWSGGSYGNPDLTATQLTGTASWLSGSTSTGNLFALQLTRKATGEPETYVAFGKSAATTLTDGSPATVALPFVTVNSSATVSATITNPAGYDVPSMGLRQQFGTSVANLWTGMTTTVAAKIPLIAAAGGTSLFATTSIDGGGTSSYVYPLTGDTTVSFTMPAAAVLVAPADTANGVTSSTPLMWTPGADTISEVVIGTSGTTRVVYRVFTAASEVTIPSVTEAPLPSGQSFSWSVNGYGPSSSIDDAADSNEVETFTQNDFQGPAHAYTRSTTRTFSTP